ncbi:carbohydrate ABC transporter permease [Streptomyces sp. NBC_00257]|uniref:carbohydrate ABC transporter permease n=1 Tax=Streptomyces TaxID=1883 RepID=UPI00225902F1|nr:MULTISPECIES: carbohydrate ABC transporter permease [unclassified Streptomyces]WTB58343.1 carbohydrate ABC transporter permease [Streptomyces sp. NBC_00826]WTH88777.1 carbohydrate ABC transporter permease [Streptomyces sp. NBC_00825]WTH97507.1 carbohydrate ABC transporter permease [Streptomyces sp. NBC_00822]MCX4863025.1 carbohydrate ABC transporter permease [Streptomyces sp. NBC_00906]MCX4894262.1 carbohydrate ABC transporter permease [Streptomyces sp. NBC_00892]
MPERSEPMVLERPTTAPAKVKSGARSGRPAEAGRRRPGARGRAGQGVLVAALSGMVLVALFPYLFMFMTSFKTNEEFNTNYWVPTWPLHLSNYGTAWEQIQPYFITSILVAAASIVGTVGLSTIAGFLFARYEFAGRRLLYGMVVMLMMVPPVASLIPLFVLMRDLNLLNTLTVLILPHIAGSVVLATILIRTFVEQIPQELFDAARIDGAGGPRLFRSIVLPLSLPVIGTVSLLTVINVWNDFFWPLLVITENDLRTIPVGLSFFKGQNVTQWGPLFAGYTLASLPLLLLFTFLSKHFLAGMQGGLPGSGK